MGSQKGATYQQGGSGDPNFFQGKGKTMTERGSGFFMITFNLAFTVLAALALIVGGWSSVATIFAASGYFVLSSSLFVLAATGGLRDVLLSGIDACSNLIKLVLLIFYKWQVEVRMLKYQSQLVREANIQARLALVDLELQENYPDSDSNQGDSFIFDESIQALWDEAQDVTPKSPSTFKTFVSAVPGIEASNQEVQSTRPRMVAYASQSDMIVREQARAWLKSLFDERTGDVRGDKLHITNSSATDGWLKCKAPLGDVRKFLLQKKVLISRPNGLALNRQLVDRRADIDVVIP